MIHIKNLLNANWQEKKRKDLVKESYQKLLKIFDVLEDSLLPSRKEKKLHQQRKGMHSNISEANQELAINDWILYIVCFVWIC